MALWYARQDKVNEGRGGFLRDYIFSHKKLRKVKNALGIDFWIERYHIRTFDETTVCPISFNACHPKSMHLAPGEGPYKLKPLERA